MDLVADIDRTEIIESRPFTHPAHTAKDRRTMMHMIRQLCAYLKSDPAARNPREAKVFPEPNGSMHRILVPDVQEILSTRPLTLVGFYGQKRADADPNHFSPLDRILRERIPDYQDIMSYSTLAVEDDNFANLVLLRSEAAKAEWHGNPTHLDAIDRSPGYYESIRIYNGVLGDGLRSPDILHLAKVKYWDYRSGTTWRGVRTLV